MYFFIKEPLELSHKDLISKACSTLALPFSEYNFSNLYLFRKAHDYQVLHLNNTQFVLLGKSYEGTSFLMPFLKPEKWEDLLQLARHMNVSYLYPIHETWGPFPSQCSFNEGDCDYLYDTETIASYRGRHLDGQRNAIRGLLSKHAVLCSIFSEKDTSDAESIVDDWSNWNKQERADIEACKEGILLTNQFGIQGIIVEVDGKKMGFLLGERLTSTTFLVHFAKVRRPLHGLYAYMFQELAKKILPFYPIMNWEQDLGLETLRHTKQSYHPTSLLMKGCLQVAYI